jgi:uracil-DNA glycosylase
MMKLHNKSAQPKQFILSNVLQAIQIKTDRDIKGDNVDNGQFLNNNISNIQQPVQISIRHTELTQTQAPQIQAPQTQAPQIQAPQIQAPQIQAPQIQAPQIQAPQIQAPQIQPPQIQAPQIQAPQIQAPQIQAPQIQAPQIQAPQIQAPQIQAPQMPAKIKLLLPVNNIPSTKINSADQLALYASRVSHLSMIETNYLENVANDKTNDKTNDTKPKTSTIVLRIANQKQEIKDDWNLLDIVQKSPPIGWEQVFKDSYAEFVGIYRILQDQITAYGRYYPNNKDLFKAFDLCPLSKVKVVIIGQDPYHTTDHSGNPVAQGMSFSVNKNVPIPSSLKNIFKELESTVHGFVHPNHGDLSEWAKQGVLLLNTCLTVRPGDAGSHKSIWMGFIAKVVAAINAKNPSCIYVLWGKHAKDKIGELLSNKNIRLEAVHPSGLSANRGFFGCNHFNMINKHLEDMNLPCINWQV